MPLKKGNSESVIAYNIKELMNKNHSQKQAIAIAMNVAGKKKKKYVSKKK